MSDAIESLFKNAGVLPSVPQQTSFPSGNGVCDLPISTLVELEQPFRCYNETDMEAMRLSIASHGIIQRLIVRPYGDQYQIIAGRNRCAAARLAGFDTVPCEIRELSDDEAEILMIETNLNQRLTLLPSERAWAYRKLHEAMKRQGQSTSGSDFPRARDALGSKDGVSGRQVQNYIALTDLTPSLLTCVDEEKLGINAGVQLSNLSTKNQDTVYDFFFFSHKHPLSEELAAAVRAAGEKKELTPEVLSALAFGPRPGKQKLVKSIPLKPIKKLFPKNATATEIQATTVAAVKFYFESGQCVIRSEPDASTTE